MKKNVFFTISLFLIIFNINAASFSDLLDDAKKQYSDGNYEESIRLLESAKKIAENNKISQSGSYINVPNLTTIDLKSDMYMGKKVKVRCYVSAITKNSLDLCDDRTMFRFCTFDSSLIDKILTIDTIFTDYTFSGTVTKNKYGDVSIHIESISDY